MCVDMGGSHFRERWVHMGFSKRGFIGGGSRKGGFTGGFTKRGVHMNPVIPPGYGPGGFTKRGVHRGVHKKGGGGSREPCEPPGYGPGQVTHLPPVWDLLLHLFLLNKKGN